MTPSDHTGGYVKLWRRIMDDPVWEDEALLKTFLWCVLRAAHGPRQVQVRTGRGSTEVQLQRGQFVFGRNAGADQLKCPPASLQRRIFDLTKSGKVQIKTNSHYSIITVCKYTRWQGVIEENTRDQANYNDNRPPESENSIRQKPAVSTDGNTDYKSIKAESDQANSETGDGCRTVVSPGQNKGCRSGAGGDQAKSPKVVRQTRGTTIDSNKSSESRDDESDQANSEKVVTQPITNKNVLKKEVTALRAGARTRGTTKDPKPETAKPGEAHDQKRQRPKREKKGNITTDPAKLLTDLRDQERERQESGDTPLVHGLGKILGNGRANHATWCRLDGLAIGKGLMKGSRTAITNALLDLARSEVDAENPAAAFVSKVRNKYPKVGLEWKVKEQSA